MEPLGGIVDKFTDTMMTGIMIVFLIPVGIALILVSPIMGLFWLVGALGKKVGLAY